MRIDMVDLMGQYHYIKTEIDEAIMDCIESSEFVNGRKIEEFANNLAIYTGAKYVIPCANGTDALQIALMALNLKQGDEVIVPAFTYAATVEVIALLRLVPVMVDVHKDDFSISLEQVKKAITPKTKAIIPVHLYGQCAQMEALMELAKSHNLFVVEDAAQAIGAQYTFKDGTVKQAGTIGHIGTTSFFPSKNLGCFGDGGAIFTDDESLATPIKMISNHGQSKKYHHDIVGVNSRLDTLQAAVLNVKLKYLNQYSQARNDAAKYYDEKLKIIAEIELPKRNQYSTHVFHQYTIRVKNGQRNSLKKYLEEQNIQTMVYYPLPLHFQKAYQNTRFPKGSIPVSEELCECVLSLPMHTEMTTAILDYIITAIHKFFATKV